MTYQGHSHQYFGSTTYSQHGEDFHLVNLIHLLKLQKPTYLDLGAYHPYHISNSALLYQRGFRGINIDANHRVIEVFQKERPEDQSYALGIGVESGVMPFYLESEQSVLNSLVQEHFDKHLTVYRSVEFITVVTLNQLVDEKCQGFFPEILLMDIEGMDLPVLKNTEFERSKPKIVLAEIELKDTHSAIQMMESKGFYLMTRIVSNLLFIDRHYHARSIGI